MTALTMETGLTPQTPVTGKVATAMVTGVKAQTMVTGAAATKAMMGILPPEDLLTAFEKQSFSVSSGKGSQ